MQKSPLTVELLSDISDFEEKKLPHLRGILYFTDGYGIFPENPPQNKADIAFVFWKEEDYDASNVPDWAMKLIID